MQGHGDVLADIQGGIERVELEHHGDIALFRRQVIHAFAGNDHVTFSGALEACDHAERCCLAAARWAEEADNFAGLNRKVSILDGNELAVFLGDLPDFNG
jgi:hypothetical protein